VEEGGIVAGFGEACWAAAVGSKQEHAIKIVRTPRKIIRCRPTLNSVGSDALHVLFHELSTQYKGFGGLAMMTQPESADKRTVSASFSRNGTTAGLFICEVNNQQYTTRIINYT